MKLHETDKGYILDVLYDEEDRLYRELFDNLDENLRYKLSRLIAVENEIYRISSWLLCDK